MPPTYTPALLTRRLISYNTVNPPGNERECATFIGDLLSAGGFDVGYHEFAPRRTSLVARKIFNGDRPPLCFSGHLDTVPLGLSQWAGDPFSGDTDGDRICRALQAWLGEDVALNMITEFSAVASDPQDRWVREVFDVMESYIAERPVPRGVSYFTDASALTAAFGHPPTVILGPGEPGMAHKTDEFCRLSRIEEATAAYTDIAGKWCGLF